AHYLLPAYPALAVLVAGWWTHSPENGLDRVTWKLLAIVLIGVVPAAALVLVSIDPVKVMPVLATRGHRLAAAAEIALATRLGPRAWYAAAVGLVGIAFLAARAARRPVLAAVAAATSGIAVHLLAAMVTLPAFNAIASARPVGEALGRAGDDGVDVFTYGFDNPEAVSPFMFYATRTLPEVRGQRE